MKKVGYVGISKDRQFVVKQMEELEKMGLKDIVVEKSTGESIDVNSKLNQTVEELQSDDVLVVYELRSLNKTIIQLAEFFKQLKQKNIVLSIINKGDVYQDFTDVEYYHCVYKIAEMEKMIISERTSKGLEVAREEGRVGGRPKISEQTIKKVKFLYYQKSYTFRQIADECDISVGTAYKYIQKA